MPVRRDAHAIDQFPELPARQRIDAGRRLVEDQKIGIVDQRAAQAEFLPHAAGKLLRRPVRERLQAGAVQQLGDAPLPFVAGLSEQPREKLDVLADAEIGIKVPAQSLRHVGDARADRAAVCRVRHVAAQYRDAAGLDPPRAGDDGKQRRFADAVGSDHADHATGRQVKRDGIERHRARVTLRDALQAGDRPAGRVVHYGGDRCNAAGQAVAGSVRI